MALIASRWSIEFTGLSQVIAGLYGDQASAAEIEVIADAKSYLGYGSTLATRLRNAEEISATPPIEAISAAITASAISTLLVGAIRGAVRENITSIAEADGIPDATKQGVLFCAVGQLERTVYTLDHGCFVGAGTFEIHGTTRVGHAFSSVRIAEFGSFARSADSATPIASTFLLFAERFAVRFVAKSVFQTACEAGWAIAALAPAPIGAAVFSEAGCEWIADGNASSVVIAGFSVFAKTADGTTVVVPADFVLAGRYAGTIGVFKFHISGYRDKGVHIGLGNPHILFRDTRILERGGVSPAIRKNLGFGIGGVVC